MYQDVDLSHLSNRQIVLLNRVIDKGVVNEDLPYDVHNMWVRMRAKMDRLTGDAPLRRLLGGRHEETS